MSGNDEVTFWVCSFFRLSSEDSEETSYYLDDSDDSGEMAKTSVPPGEMDLLGEILDTLSTHSSDQGKLSGAKSLDFFRSMDDIDYKTVVRFPQLSRTTSLLLCDNLYLVVGLHSWPAQSVLWSWVDTNSTVILYSWLKLRRPLGKQDAWLDWSLSWSSRILLVGFWS